MFQKLALAVSLGVLAIGAARADTLCNSFGGPENVATSGLSCSLGGLTFSGFQVSPSAGNQAPEIDLMGANIAADGTVNLQFDPNMSTPGDGASQAIDFFFVVTGGINQIDLSVGGANASITETVCDAAFGTSNNCTGNELASISAFSAPPVATSAISQFFATTSPLYVFKHIDVEPGASGGALGNFSQSFHPGVASDVAPVPESSSFTLLGLGLIGLSFFGRRQLKKS
jgi:hypothetical protein